MYLPTGQKGAVLIDTDRPRSPANDPTDSLRKNVLLRALQAQDDRYPERPLEEPMLLVELQDGLWRRADGKELAEINKRYPHFFSDHNS